MAGENIKIVVADDSGLLRALLAHEIGRQPDMEVVGQATDGQQAVDIADRLQPDVVLMDLDMPLLTGIQATEQILARRPGIAVVLLSGHENLLPLGRQVGAAECLPKNCAPQELVATIRKVHENRTAQALVATPAEAPDPIGQLAQRWGLTEREAMVIELMVNTELTARQIAQVVAEKTGSATSEAAIKHTLERSLIKLQIEPRTRVALMRFVLSNSGSR
ncbi:MAG: response regulator transcription factor [Armatimonas sp.]